MKNEIVNFMTFILDILIYLIHYIPEFINKRNNFKFINL